MEYGRIGDIISTIIRRNIIHNCYTMRIKLDTFKALSIITDPIEEPIRQVQYRYVSLPIDFSPLIAILLIQLIQRLIFIIFW